MKKVLITATSGEDTYPTICGEHEFTSIDVPDYWDTDADVIIEIYDDYRE